MLYKELDSEGGNIMLSRQAFVGAGEGEPVFEPTIPVAGYLPVTFSLSLVGTAIPHRYTHLPRTSRTDGNSTERVERKRYLTLSLTLILAIARVFLPNPTLNPNRMCLSDQVIWLSLPLPFTLPLPPLLWLWPLTLTLVLTQAMGSAALVQRVSSVAMSNPVS